MAPSGIAFYAGRRYEGWTNDLFVTALAGPALRRLEVDGRLVVHQDLLYVALERREGREMTRPPSLVVRLVPVRDRGPRKPALESGPSRP